MKRDKSDQSEMKKLIADRRTRYAATKNTYCPFLKEVVYFNTQGLFHATHDGRGKIRSTADAKLRLNLLPRIYEVIQQSTQFARPPELIPKNDPENKLQLSIQYYELIAQLRLG